MKSKSKTITTYERKVYKPTVVDFMPRVMEILMPIVGKIVERYPNWDKSRISYGKYKGQRRWMIRGREAAGWVPCEDFVDVEVLTGEEEDVMGVLIAEMEIPLLVEVEVNKINK